MKYSIVEVYIYIYFSLQYILAMYISKNILDKKRLTLLNLLRSMNLNYEKL